MYEVILINQSIEFQNFQVILRNQSIEIQKLFNLFF